MSIPDDYLAWQSKRLNALQAEFGWLSLIGLHWLEQNGEFMLGQAPDQDIRLNAGPQRLGRLRVQLQGATKLVQFKAAAGVTHEVVHPGPVGNDNYLTLHSDAEPKASEIHVGSVRIFLIDRSGRLALRVKDSQALSRTQFSGLRYFPYEPKLRIDARYIPYPDQRSIDIVTIVGGIEPTPNIGRAEFQIDGKDYALELLKGESPNQFFTVFGDRTNNKETYGMARFLAGPIDTKANTVLLDFNRAYNPPCAFTEYATCPMPPPSNRLPVAIRAGELKYQTAQ